jgi:membrane protease YdiL (CAAX protease family)
MALLLFGAIVIGLSGYWDGIPGALRPLFKLLLPVLWLSVAWIAGATPRLKPYRSVLLAFFAVSLGIWLAWLIGSWPLRLLGLKTDSLPGLAVAKLSEAAPIVASILVVNHLEGKNLAGLCLRKGRLGLSLALGLAIGALCWLLFLAMGGWQAIAYAGPIRLLAALPLMLVFALTNSFMEELWFRGLFLSRFSPLLGARSALLVTTLAFGALHFAASYAAGAVLLQLVASTLLLGLACGLVVQHTHTLWGAVLSHAAGDMFVVIGFFVTLL